MPYILRIISGPTYILYSKYSRYSLFTLCNVNVPVGSQIWQRTEKWILFVQWELIKYRRDDDDKVSTDTASVVTNTAWRHTAKYRHTHHHRHHHHVHSVHYRQKHTDTITYTDSLSFSTARRIATTQTIHCFTRHSICRLISIYTGSAKKVKTTR